MAEIVTRLSRSTALSFSEVDNNFLAINAEVELVHANTFIQVPNISGLPASTANGSLVEVADTTDIQLSGLVTGVPVGFTGSNQFTARLKYVQATPTNGVPAPGRWQWIDYDAKDPNSRYSTQSLQTQIADLVAQLAVLEERVRASSAVGDVKFTTMAANPPGWIEANGAVLSRSGYSELFEVFGTRYGAGNGTTTFRIPDYRGVVLRGLDAGRGYDPLRAQGSYQADQNKAQTINPTTSHNITATGSFAYNQNTTALAGAQAVTDVLGTGSTKSVDITVSGTVSVSPIEIAGGDETRVKNIAERAIIKAFSRAANAVVSSADIRLLLHLNGSVNDSSLYQDTPYIDGFHSLPSYSNTPVFFSGQSALFATNTVKWDLGAALVGEFCVDLRLYVNSGATAPNRYVVSLGYTSLEVGQNGSALVERAAPFTSPVGIMSVPAGTVPIGQFVHLAWTRSAVGLQRLYLNGNQIASGSSQAAAVPMEQYFQLGNPFSDFRAQELRLLYKDPYGGQSFTPPTQRYADP